MDPFKLLKTDHKKVSQLFKEIEAASAGSSKSQLFSQLKSELDLHAHIEEKYLYPALENKKESREITLEAYEEHNVVKDLLAELATRSPDDEWDAKLTVLKENVEHHVEEEEGELFDKAESVLSEEQLQRLGAEMEAEKAAKNGGKAERPGAFKSATKSSKKAAAKTRAAAKKESPGVLTRLAKLVGLGGDEPSPARKTGTRKPARKAAKKASSSTKGTRKAAATTTKSSLARKSAKRQPAAAKKGRKAASRTGSKTKKSASKKR